MLTCWIRGGTLNWRETQWKLEEVFAIVLLWAGLFHHVMLLDVLEPKPVSTRKLRRRANDPIPLPEKRRKAMTYILLWDVLYSVLSYTALLEVFEG